MLKNMKKILLFFLLSSVTCFAQQVKTFLNYASFSNPEQGPFIEIYLSIIGGSLNYVKNETGKYQGMLRVKIAFYENDSIALENEYNLLSPEYTSEEEAKLNFIDQQRYALKNGQYEMRISISDATIDKEPYVLSETVKIEYSNNLLALSDFELIENYTKSTVQGPLTKSGIDIIPYVSNFYPENFNRLSFYIELYNIDKIIKNPDKFMFNYYIESYENSVTMNQFSHFVKMNPQAVNVLLGEFLLDDLPSGNYNLVVNIKDKENNSLVSKKCFFQRRNPNVQLKMDDIKSVSVKNTFVENITEFDELKEHTKSLRPIASDNEKIFIDNQIKANQFELMQQFFLSFWQKRNPDTPEASWLKYLAEVKKVNAAFGANILKGYETDRGRVYLQYGPPDTRSESPSEPSAYPYEIWHYHQLKQQTNRRFIFYDPSFSTNNYLLIHSDAVGEIRNDRWQYVIHKRNTNTIDLDDTETPDHFGDQSKDIFDNPY